MAGNSSNSLKPEAPQCIFCKIASGQSKSYKVYEDASFVGILDAFPVTEGHLLLVPKKHFKTFFDLPDADLSGAFSVARKLAGVMKKALGADGFNIATAPSAIDHFHIHVIPRYDYDLMGPLADLDNKREMAPEKMAAIHKKIVSVIEEKPKA
jgi:histidine triad (HIT) family protein